MSVRVYVGLGGNVGGERALASRFARALRALRDLPCAREVGRSALYVTAPQGPVRDQPPFCNAAVALEVAGDPGPSRVVAELLRIEAELGRDRGSEKRLGPRALDLDLLLYGDRVVSDPGPPPAEVPHPRLGQRAFALRPLADLPGGDVEIPGLGATAPELLAEPGVREQPLSTLQRDFESSGDG